MVLKIFRYSNAKDETNKNKTNKKTAPQNQNNSRAIPLHCMQKLTPNES